MHLEAFLPESCFHGRRPHYISKDKRASDWSENAVLLAVRHFLVLKAGEIVPATEANNMQTDGASCIAVNITPDPGNGLSSSMSQATTCQPSPEAGFAPAPTAPSSTLSPITIPGSLKRSRSESRSSTFTSILQGTRDLESIFQEQEQEIAEPKAQAGDLKELVRAGLSN